MDGELAERQDELRRLNDLLTVSMRGTSRIAVVIGPPGSGKTRLLQEFANQAKRAGAVVASSVGTFSVPELPETPGCVIVDDADLNSLDSLVTRAHSAGLMLLISAQSISAEFPHTVLRLGPLSEDGVAQVLAQRVDPETARRLAPACHAASGGNPQLVHALAEDLPLGGADLVAGEAYRRAVVACLHRADLVQPAAVLAVLGDTPVPLAEFGGSPLADMGLVVDGRFAHPAARTAVLNSLSPAYRSEVHLRAVRLLHRLGAADRLVAEHLIAFNAEIDDPWVLAVLHKTAREALAANDLHLAEQCLRLAVRACSDERHRVTLLLDLLRAEWAIEPSLGARHVPQLINAARQGLLEGTDLMVLVYQSLWFGRVEDAVSLFDKAPAPEDAVLRRWLSCFYPSLLSSLGPTGDVPKDDLRGTALACLHAVLSQEANNSTIPLLEHVLVRCLPGAQPLQPELVAVSALIYLNELERARSWIELLLDSAPGRNTPSWEGGFASMQAEISLRLGDPEEAVHWAHTSLNLMSSKGWGIAVGRSRAALVMAALATSDVDEAAYQLNHPVPPAMHKSLWGMHYGHARGRYHLATDNVHAALSEFLRCGDLLTRWDIDNPAVVPWRASAIEAYERLGRLDRAEQIRAHGPITPLTDAERRVAMLAAEGHPNRSISRQLHITVSTVEQHLTRTYRKLNVTCRAQLAERLRVIGALH